MFVSEKGELENLDTSKSEEAERLRKLRDDEGHRKKREAAVRAQRHRLGVLLDVVVKMEKERDVLRAQGLKLVAGETRISCFTEAAKLDGRSKTLRKEIDQLRRELRK
jgi:hypothetical protein